MYDNNTEELAANYLKTKLLLNSTKSNASKGASFILADIKDHYLAIPMKDSKFICIN